MRTNLAADDAAFNCVFEIEDELGIRGIKLAKELMNVAGACLGGWVPEWLGGWVTASLGCWVAGWQRLGALGAVAFWGDSLVLCVTFLHGAHCSAFNHFGQTHTWLPWSTDLPRVLRAPNPPESATLPLPLSPGP